MSIGFTRVNGILRLADVGTLEHLKVGLRLKNTSEPSSILSDTAESVLLGQPGIGKTENSEIRFGFEY